MFKQIKMGLLLKIIGGLAYALLFAEAFLRLLSPIAVFPRYVTAAPYGIRVNEPNRSYWHTSAEVSIQIRTNAKGIRADREIPYQKPPGVKRIVVLGDSFAMGYEVSLDDMFTTRMAEELKAAGINVEVVNLAVSGHGNAEELIILQEEGLKYQPDLVLLCWHSTDLAENIRSALYELKGNELVRNNKTYLPGVAIQQKLYRIPGYEWISVHSQLYGWVREAVAVRVVKPLLLAIRGGQRSASDDENCGATPADGYPKQLTVALLREIERNSRQMGAEFLILDIPGPDGRGGFLSVFPRDENSGTFGLLVISPIDVFLKHKGQKLYHERSHRHFTPLGCRLVGRCLARHVGQRGLLGGKSALAMPGVMNETADVTDGGKQ